jgi:hypothetical protein
MTPQASQTVPEKPRDRVSVKENDVPDERDDDWKAEEGVQELRSCRSSGVAEFRRRFRKAPLKGHRDTFKF